MASPAWSIVGNSIDTTGSVGIGTQTPSAQLSVVLSGGSELGGSARSSTLLTSSGALKTDAGSEVPLASLGLTVGNYMSLGIRAIRTVAGDGWDKTAIGVGVDVDNTVRAGAALFLHANGGVGIGTPTPAGFLTVSGANPLQGAITFFNQAVSADIEYDGGSDQLFVIHAVNNAKTALLGGDVGIGTATPTARFSIVQSGATELGNNAHSSALLVSSGTLGTTPGSEVAAASFGVKAGNDLSLGIRAVRTSAGGDWNTVALGLGMDVDDTVRAGAALFLHANNNVGIGTSLPASKLHVSGDVTVTGDILLTGADCAEQFDVSGEPPEPGTVLVIDEAGILCESQKPYDKKVAGVVSGGGEYKHGILLDNRPSDNCRVPVALVGKACCKVDARYSAIEVGDLLTTSSTPGYAMKAVEPLRTSGAVIGKALAPLATGRALIPILIALQ
jgi:hypothetical protein